jgi:hypothetical protein
MSPMIEGVIGAQLLNLSAVVALRIIRAENDACAQGTRILDFVLVLGGAVGGCLGIIWFLDHLGPFALIFWPLSCLTFVMGVWPVEERARTLLGFVSLTAGAVLLFASKGFLLHPDRLPPRTPSFCLGCTR